MTLALGAHKEIADMDDNRPHPLSEWVEGTIEVAFVGGGKITERACQAAALKLVSIGTGARGGDSLSWDTADWLVTTAEVAAIRWESDLDCGWPLTDAQRHEQAKYGHEHGSMRSLVEFYENRLEPSFSFNALVCLASLACSISIEEWKASVERLEGAKGADVATQILTGEAHDEWEGSEETSEYLTTGAGSPRISQELADSLTQKRAEEDDES